MPVYAGLAAADILRAAAFWGSGVDLQETGHLRHREPSALGPFTITPYLADHSAFDAYSLLIEAGGRRLLYSGDLRGHGRKHRAFTELLTDPPTDVDALLLEGTNMHEPGDHSVPAEPLLSEDSVEQQLTDTLRATRGLVVVLGSAQNIDRLVTVYRAALRADRNLAVDMYARDIAAATDRPSIPRPADGWPRVRAYVPLRQRVRVKESGQFDRTGGLLQYRIFDEHLASRPGNWVLYGAYQSELPRLFNAGLLRHGAVVWSMWEGYLSERSGTRLTTLLADNGTPLHHSHTSGHATPDDLRRLVNAINPRSLVPIHTDAPQRYAEVLGRDPSLHRDGDWWHV